ncbi:hypothetical protein J6590_041043 [Homalodisca vitripennis]|nr:hypothetical protein J6590_041043 [Homalodisca vitripennis]
MGIPLLTFRLGVATLTGIFAKNRHYCTTFYTNIPSGRSQYIRIICQEHRRKTVVCRLYVTQCKCNNPLSVRDVIIEQGLGYRKHASLARLRTSRRVVECTRYVVRTCSWSLERDLHT